MNHTFQFQARQTSIIHSTYIRSGRGGEKTRVGGGQGEEGKRDEVTQHSHELGAAGQHEPVMFTEGEDTEFRIFTSYLSPNKSFRFLDFYVCQNIACEIICV